MNVTLLGARVGGSGAEVGVVVTYTDERSSVGDVCTISTRAILNTVFDAGHIVV